MNPLRILVLCYEFPPVGGGGGRVAESVARALAGRGHEVCVHTAGLRGLPRLEVRDGVQIRRSPTFRRRAESCTVAEMGMYVALGAMPACRLALGWRPDVIHCHFAMPTGPVAWVAARVARVPYVLTAHLGDVPGGVPGQTDRIFRWVGPAARRIWRDAAAATAVSSFVRDLALRAYGRDVECIPNGIVPGPEPDCRPGDPVRLVFAGRFNPQKNLPMLMRALARLPGEARWRLDLVGDGPDRGEVERLASVLGERVRFHGWLGTEATVAVLRASDVLVMPSWSEGMPVVGVQALDAGLAVAGSDVPGLADVLQPGVNGFAVPPDDEAGFAEELGRLIADPDRLAAMQRASRRLAARFDLAARVDDYERVLRTAADCREGR